MGLIPWNQISLSNYNHIWLLLSNTSFAYISYSSITASISCGKSNFYANNPELKYFLNVYLWIQQKIKEYFQKIASIMLMGWKLSVKFQRHFLSVLSLKCWAHKPNHPICDFWFVASISRVSLPYQNCSTFLLLPKYLT